MDESPRRTTHQLSAKSGRVRYVSYLLSMRQRKGWISRGLPIPESTLTSKRLKGANEDGPVEIEAYKWLENERNKSSWLLGDVRLLKQWNQTLTLLWFEEGADKEQMERLEEDEDPGLRELDGTLPWPGKRRRK